MELQALKNRFRIIGNNAGLNYALSIAERVASTNLSVLITGESGVGKEIFSQIIHSLSPRKHNPFIAVNCGAIPEGTIDSELFGHEKGSFTNATETRKGYFETVNGGTIFLDEIGEMPIGTQARLLRILESGEFLKVGSSKVQKTDVRVVAATNVNLLEKVQAGRFREDLYYRLNTVPIKVPPLRERKEDIYPLFRKFVVDFAESYRTEPIQLQEDAKQILVNYSFPGNVRELKNIAEQMSVLSKDKIVTASELQQFIPINVQNNLPILSAQSSQQEGQGFFERELLYKVLFDMKKDLNELKKITFELMSINGMEHHEDMNTIPKEEKVNYDTITHNQPAVTIQPKQEAHAIEVEESMSLADMEKKMIIQALIKYKSRRRDAAEELGISERTLYRKINEYNIDL